MLLVCLPTSVKNDRPTIFNGIDSQTVELKITNYQFPEMKLGEFDENWLLVC
jgi:hypothetical protein